MTEWLKEEEAREAEREQERLERLERRLAGPRDPRFADPEFEQQLRDMAESVKDSVMKGKLNVTFFTWVHLTSSTKVLNSLDHTDVSMPLTLETARLVFFLLNCHF